ncbi:uncharacterized protein V1516DRAFT_670842 [Lipomyces oligophaga]|uniref:uncharacterized protein n=1 Tax=Lipomyces oligophaga TaxID=45792 RepID=UPI0034CD0922
MSSIQPIQPKILHPVHPYPVWEPRDTVAITAPLLGPCFTIGVMWSATMERLRFRNPPAVESIIRISKNAFVVGAVGPLFQFVEAASSNLREKNDGWNSFFGGLASGALLSLPTGSFNRVFVSSVGLGSVLGIAAWSGFGTGEFLRTSRETLPEVNWRNPFYDVSPSDNSIKTYEKSPESESLVRYRVPLSETLEKLGEGRGIHRPETPKDI